MAGQDNLKPFQKGDDPRRNKGGRPKDSVTALWRRLLSEVDGKERKGRTRGEALFHKAYSLAMGGDVAAIRLIVERVEGKPRQPVTLTLDQRDKYERMVDRLIADEAAEGRRITREEAIAAIEVVEPLVSELLN